MPLTLKPGVLEVRGADAQSFLQAIVASDVHSVSVGSSQPSLLLTPSGKVVSTMWIVRVSDDQFLIVSEWEKIDSIETSLKRLLIRTKASIEDVSEQYNALLLHEGTDLPESAIVIEEGHLGLTDANLILVARSQEHESNDQDTSDYNELRISWGVVSTQQDLADEVIPQEANLQRAVSFTKGCFLGQELVCRIDSREATTPFSIYSFTRELGEVGAQTSSRTSEVASYDGFACGPFVSIIRVPRKATADLVKSDAQLVSGYFAL